MVSPSDSTPRSEVLSTSLLEAPSPSCHPRGIQRSQDGQLLTVTRTAISITTPNLGYAPSASSDELPVSKSAYLAAYDVHGKRQPNKQTVSDREQAGLEQDSISTFTTKIKLPHYDESIDWADPARGGSTDSRVITLGGQSGEFEWRAACWSPSGTSRLGGCVVAALSSNLEVSIYAPSKNPLVGEWVLLESLTPLLFEATDYPTSTPQTEKELGSWEGNDQWHVKRVMDCQTLCMSWSPRIHGGELSGQSILALGHKAGTITFWSVSSDFKMTFLLKTKASDRWITSLTFQDWNHATSSKASIRLAFTTAAGSVDIATISLGASKRSTVSLESATKIHEPDDRPLTGLEWAQADRELLVCTRPGKITLWSPSVEAGKRGWVGERAVLLAKLESWPGVSKLSTCSGINSFTPTSLVVTLADGTFHLIDSLDGAEPKYNLAVSKYMSSAARQVFEEAEELRAEKRIKKSLSSQVVMRCSGALYLGQGIWTWNHQPTTPHDISYLIPSALFSVVVTCHIPTHSQPQRASHLKAFQKTLNDVRTSLEASSAALVSPHLMPFACKSETSPSEYDLLSPHLLRAVRQLPVTRDDQPAHPAEPACPARLEDVKPWLARGLKQALWETSSLAKLRVRYALATYLSTVEGPQRDDFASQSEALSRLIITRSLAIILDWAGKVKAFIKGPADLRYLEHLIHALLSIYLASSLTPSLSLDLTATSAQAGAAFDLALSFDPPLNIAVDPHALEGLIQHAQVPLESEQAADLPEWAQGREGLPSWLGEGGGEVVEVCPGCEEEVRFGDLELAVCKEEHVFDRCSISLGVISAAQHRKCLTCARPAMLSASFPVGRKRRGGKQAKVEGTEGIVPSECADGDVVMDEAGAGGEEGGGGAEGAAEREDWLLEQVLETGQACIYCGGRFALAM